MNHTHFFHRPRVYLLAKLIAMSLVSAVAVSQADTNVQRTVQFLEPHSVRYVLIESTTNTSGRADQHWTRARLEKGDTNTVEFGSRVVLELTPGTDLSSVISNKNLSLARTVRSNLFILQAGDSQATIDAADLMAGRNGVITSAPVMRRALKLHSA
jgi:hypothetical protein